MDHPFASAPHQLRLCPPIGGKGLFLVSHGNRRFHLAQEGTDAGYARAIYFRTLLRLPDALLGGSMLSHCETFFKILGSRRPLVVTVPGNVNGNAKTTACRAGGMIRW